MPPQFLYIGQCSATRATTSGDAERRVAQREGSKNREVTPLAPYHRQASEHSKLLVASGIRTCFQM